MERDALLLRRHGAFRVDGDARVQAPGEAEDVVFSVLNRAPVIAAASGVSATKSLRES